MTSMERQREGQADALHMAALLPANADQPIMRYDGNAPLRIAVADCTSVHGLDDTWDTAGVYLLLDHPKGSTNASSGIPCPSSRTRSRWSRTSPRSACAASNPGCRHRSCNARKVAGFFSMSTNRTFLSSANGRRDSTATAGEPGVSSS